MSRSQGTHSPHIPYDPLPLAHDPRNTVYREPNSPLAASFDTPPVELTNFQEGMQDSAAPPRFLPAVASEFRDSLVSQGTSQIAPSAGNSSVYALRPDSGAEFTAYHDDPAVPAADLSESPRYLEEKRSTYSSPLSKSRRKIVIFGSIAAAIVIIVAVVVPVCLTVLKHKANNNDTTSAPSPTSTGTGTGGSSLIAVTGGNGSTITTENGTTFTYINPFGGTWYWDENDPFNNNAQANSWTPPLNQTFGFGIDKIFGSVTFQIVSSSPSDNFCHSSVNLGGWLVTEPVSRQFPRSGVSPNLLPAVHARFLVHLIHRLTINFIHTVHLPFMKNIKAPHHRPLTSGP